MASQANQAKRMGKEMKIAKILLEEGGEIPRFYGFSYMEWHASRAAYYLVPLNLIVRAWRSICLKIKNLPPAFFERELRREFKRGCRLGRECAKERIIKDMMNLVEKAGEERNDQD